MCRDCVCARTVFVQGLICMSRDCVCAGIVYVQGLCMCRDCVCAGTVYVQGLCMCRDCVFAGIVQGLCTCRDMYVHLLHLFPHIPLECCHEQNIQIRREHAYMRNLGWYSGWHELTKLLWTAWSNNGWCWPSAICEKISPGRLPHALPSHMHDVLSYAYALLSHMRCSLTYAIKQKPTKVDLSLVCS